MGKVELIKEIIRKDIKYVGKDGKIHKAHEFAFICVGGTEIKFEPYSQTYGNGMEFNTYSVINQLLVDRVVLVDRTKRLLEDTKEDKQDTKDKKEGK